MYTPAPAHIIASSSGRLLVHPHLLPASRDRGDEELVEHERAGIVA